MSRRDIGQGIALTVGSLLAVGVLSEIALWVFAPLPNPYWQFDLLHPRVNQYIRLDYPRNYRARTEAEPGLPGIKGQNLFTTDNMGFRGGPFVRPKPAGEFRIFLVGGSTTECFFVDDKDEIGAQLQEDLAADAPPGRTIRVYNTGISGAATDDHVAMIGERLALLQPDLVVVFAGINDLLRTINGYDWLHYVEPKPPLRRPWYKRMVVHTQIGRRLYYLEKRIDTSDRDLIEGRRLRSEVADKARRERDAPPSNAVPPADTTSYADNLVTMVGMARAHGFRLVFMTQQTTWASTVDPNASHWHWLRHWNGVTYGEQAMNAALGHLNDTARRVAAERGVPVFDLARRMPKSLQYFYDDCHFNVEGSRTAARWLADFLTGHGLVPARDASGSH